jgi:phospholipid transport system substrate-binding protein
MMSRRFLRLPLVLAALLLCASPALAASPGDAAQFIDGLVSGAIGLIADQKISDQDREQRFNALLHNDFDIPRISRFVLGRYWNGASEQERQDFARLFEQWVVRTYAMRFHDYSGEKIKVAGARAEGDSGAVVSSQIIRPNGGPPIKIDWRLRQDGGNYKIVDVDVEGVSMALTEREEMASVIQHSGGTIAGLNRTLEQKLAMTEARSAAH